MIRYTIWRRLGSLFWNSLLIPKKSVVASFVGNLSLIGGKQLSLNNSNTCVYVPSEEKQCDLGEEDATFARTYGRGVEDTG
jgi:hypothetical protein